MKFIKLLIFCVLSLFYSLHPRECSGQYILGQIEPPDNFVFQVLLEEDEAIQYVFSECDDVIRQDINLTAEDKKYFKDRYSLDIEEDSFKVYAGLKAGRIARHAIILDCIGCFRPITFILSVNPNGWINDLNVMIYREARGGEVINERFLGQFRGKNIENLDDIDIAVTGATASAQCLCNGTRKGMLLLHEFLLNKRLQMDKSSNAADKADFSSDKKAEHTGGYLAPFAQMQLINGTPAIVSVRHSSERDVVKAMDMVFAEMKRVDGLIIKEGKRLNRKGRKKPMEYSGEFTNLITLCKKYSEETNGIFDITVRDKNKNTSYSDIIIDGNMIAFANKKTQIDLSLIKNGYVIDRGIEKLKNNGISIAAINYGDTTQVIGKLPGNESWKIGIRYLNQKDLILGYVSISDKAISVTTNPNYYKLNTIRIMESGQLLNRITNATVSNNQWASVACAKTALEAAILSYVIFVSGLDKNGYPFDDSASIDYALIYDDSEGNIKYKASKWIEERFHQKTGYVYEYGKAAPVCECEVKS